LAIKVRSSLRRLTLDRYSSSISVSAAARASLRFEFECCDQNRAQGSPATLRATALV
jgi:hypothetical protein